MASHEYCEFSIPEVTGTGTAEFVQLPLESKIWKIIEIDEKKEVICKEKNGKFGNLITFFPKATQIRTFSLFLRSFKF